MDILRHAQSGSRVIIRRMLRGSRVIRMTLARLRILATVLLSSSYRAARKLGRKIVRRRATGSAVNMLALDTDHKRSEGVERVF